MLSSSTPFDCLTFWQTFLQTEERLEEGETVQIATEKTNNQSSIFSCCFGSWFP